MTAAATAASARRDESLAKRIAPHAWRHRCAVWAIRLVALLVPIGLWAYETEFGSWGTETFGSPSIIWNQLYDWIAHGYIYGQIGQTLKEVAYGFLLGAGGGVVFAVVLALSQRVLWPILRPYFVAGNAVPRVVLAPIFALWFGFGLQSKVLLVAVMVFFVVFFNVFAGILGVDPLMLNSARCLGAKKRHLIVHVYLPSAAVWLLASLRTSVGFAFLAAIIGEYVAANSGIGYVIATGSSLGSVQQILCGILVVVIVTVPILYLLGLVERYIQRWRPSIR